MRGDPNLRIDSRAVFNRKWFDPETSRTDDTVPSFRTARFEPDAVTWTGSPSTPVGIARRPAVKSTT